MFCFFFRKFHSWVLHIQCDHAGIWLNVSPRVSDVPEAFLLLVFFSVALVVEIELLTCQLIIALCNGEDTLLRCYPVCITLQVAVVIILFYAKQIIWWQKGRKRDVEITMVSFLSIFFYSSCFSSHLQKFKSSVFYSRQLRMRHFGIKTGSCISVITKD